jgi:polyvinyl alcohol dehydrogenase (cytochrome)
MRLLLARRTEPPARAVSTARCRVIGAHGAGTHGAGTHGAGTHGAGRHRARGLTLGALGCGALAAGLLLPFTGGTAAATARPAPGSSWTVYHGGPAGLGTAASVAHIDTAARAWTSPRLDGRLYGEPLVWAGRVYAATENDTVYALSAATGRVAWSRHLGRPVPAGDLPCGDIGPVVGITGTPVIDRARGEIFVVADELRRGRPAHILTGLSTSSGRPELSTDVDPPGASTAALLQRTGLNLDGGQVVFGFGGNFGDCASYRGRVVAVPAAGGRPRYFTVDGGAGESQGAVWLGGGAPAVDRAGHIWVSTGNGSVHAAGHAYDDSDGLIELSASMRRLQYFAPADWAANNAEDLDMSTVPVLLPDHQVLLAGKSDLVYLLSSAHLGGIGRALATLRSGCASNIDGGIAVTGRTAYLPCLSGILAVRAASTPPLLRVLWRTGTGGGPPVAAAGLVWTIGQDGSLYGLSPVTGAVRQRAVIGPVANHFPTPAVAGGLMLVPAASQVIAFRAATGTAGTGASGPPPAAGRSGQAGADQNRGSHGGASSSGGSFPVLPVAVGCLILIGGIGWLAGYRRSGRAR